MARRGRGEGSIIQVHGPRWGCPEPVEDGRGQMARPAHRCTGPWRLSVDMGVVDGRRKRVTVQRQTKRELLECRDQILADRQGGISHDRITVGEWLDRWLESAHIKATTRVGYEHYIKDWIKPHLGSIRLQRLTSMDVRRMVKAMEAAGRAPATIRHAKVVLGRALTVAERDRLVPRNVARHVETPAVTLRPHAILTPEEAMAVIDAATEPRDRARVCVALMGGLRQGEALGLQWGDVEVTAVTVEGSTVMRGWLHVRRTVARVKGEWVVQTPKSARSARSVPLSGVLAAALVAWRGEQWDEAGWVFPGLRSPGDPTMPWDDHDAWKAACRRAKVPEVPLHGARGTLETMLIHGGVTMTDSAAMLGHDPLTAARHYARATQASQAALAARVDELLGGARALPPGEGA